MQTPIVQWGPLRPATQHWQSDDIGARKVSDPRGRETDSGSQAQPEYSTLNASSPGAPCLKEEGPGAPAKEHADGKKSRTPNKVRFKESAIKQQRGPDAKLAKELRVHLKERKKREMFVSVQVETLDTKKRRQVKALLDSGCTISCIDRDYCKSEGMTMVPLEESVQATNADGSVNNGGLITHYVELRMTIKEHKEKWRFLVTSLGKTRLYLGHDWLTKHNPSINWVKEQIKFN